MERRGNILGNGFRYVLVAAVAMLSVLCVFPKEVKAAIPIDPERTYLNGRGAEPFWVLAQLGSPANPDAYDTYEQCMHLFTGSTTQLEQGHSYIVEGTVNVSGEITASGSVRIFLNKGSVLNAKKGIQLSDGGQLDIYEEQAGKGRINITSPDPGKAGIGGSGRISIYIRSGCINAAGGRYAPGIGINQNGNGAGSEIRICAGVVNCYGGKDGGAGIGGGAGASDIGTIALLGGTINATGNGGAGVGLGKTSGSGAAGKVLIQRMSLGQESTTSHALELVVKAVGEGGAYGLGGSVGGKSVEWVNVLSGDVTFRGDAGAAGSYDYFGSDGNAHYTYGTTWGKESEYHNWGDLVGQFDNGFAEFKNEDVRAGARRVVFDTGEAYTVVPARWLKEGEKISRPTVYRSGYTLDHWSTSPQSNDAYDFSQPMGKWESEFFRLYAVWKSSSEIDCAYVQFISNGSEVSTKKVKKGTAVTSQSAPRRTGYTFRYWAEPLDGNLTQYDFSRPVYYDQVLYAVWEYNGNPFSGSGLPNTDSADSRAVLACIFIFSALGAAAAYKLRRP